MLPAAHSLAPAGLMLSQGWRGAEPSHGELPVGWEGSAGVVALPPEQGPLATALACGRKPETSLWEE